MTEEQLQDEIREILGKFHYEAFVAGILYERDEYPQSENEWDDLHQGIQSEAVGEHYEGWAPDTIEALRKLLND